MPSLATLVKRLRGRLEIATHSLRRSNNRGIAQLRRARASLGGDANVRHVELSIAHSPADDVGSPPELVELLLASARRALTIDLDPIAQRTDDPAGALVNLWPGEHYRLLAGLARAARVTKAVEIGTYQGPGAMALRAGGCAVTTFDIIAWSDIPGSFLRTEDFGTELRQVLADLADYADYEANRHILSAAELIFVDGPKDGAFEQAFLPRLVRDFAKSGKILVVDDVRLPVMAPLWSRLDVPKIDATSLGHWSGTGIALL